MKKLLTNPIVIGLLVMAVIFLITATHYNDLSYTN